MHGDEPARVREKIRDMSERRERLGLAPMKFGVAAYAIVRNTETEAKRELERGFRSRITVFPIADYVLVWLEHPIRSPRA
jgi:alkanesulfonate monooxygenase SsuD/methylene tetrahydromethanopterin reductase-like flavin-dependent oxidoreductase (luciferase family)